MRRQRQVTAGEVAPLHEILAECGRDLRARFGLPHWDPPHPLESMRSDARERAVFLVEDDAQLVATFTIGTRPLAGYPDTQWPDGGEPALYLNRLAVRPAQQGRGLGRWCMARVEEHARAAGCASVRFDAIAGHAALLGFYRELGYTDCGPFVLQGFDVICFEKRIT